MGITVFLHLDDALVLANSYTQAKEDGQKVVHLLQRLGLCWPWWSASWNPLKNLHTLPWCSTHRIWLYNSPGQGLDNKGSGSQSGLLPYMQRSNDAAGLNRFCWHGTVTGKIILSIPTVLPQGELQDSNQSVQRAEARSRGFSGPALVVNLQGPTKINMQILNRWSSDSRCL